MNCPTCGATTTRNGNNRNGTARYRCPTCKRTYSESTGRPAGRQAEGLAPLTPAEKMRRYRERKRAG